jgi:hypothetical protein
LLKTVTGAFMVSWSSSWYSNRLRPGVRVEEVSDTTGLRAHQASARAAATLATPGPYCP